ncbi:MAG: phosphate acyltransferase PlsX [Clostridia bacterium]|nr:phosphate acyltransferase PlsX [Clostridia bacterium]
MKIIIDVMSGDNAPLELLKGAVMAAEEYRVPIAVVGDRTIIEETAKEHDVSLEKIEVIHADSVINMEDKPLSVIREKSDSSMSVGLRLLESGEGDAFVSAGNTGALLAGATLLVRRIKGIRRAAIATVLPFPRPILLMDSGANLTVTPDDLEQFAYMGAFYMEKLHGLKKARVGLINNGTEHNKGLPLQVETYARLSENTDLDFVGNVEGKEIPFSPCDVLLADGFTGNIVLKYTEGMGKFMLKTLKELFTKNSATKLAALAMKNQLTELKHQFDASEYGGAPLLGISKPVIKAHGSSDAKALKNAVVQAIAFIQTGMNYDIAVVAAELEAKNAAKKAAEKTEENPKN